MSASVAVELSVVVVVLGVVLIGVITGILWMAWVSISKYKPIDVVAEQARARAEEIDESGDDIENEEDGGAREESDKLSEDSVAGVSFEELVSGDDRASE